MFSAYARSEANRLIIGNQYLERRMVTQGGEPCVTISFVNKETGVDYARPGSREFTLSVDGRVITANDTAFKSVELREGDPVEAVVSLESDVHALTIELHYLVYSGHPVLRKWMIVRNRGKEMLTIADLDWEDVNLVVDSSGDRGGLGGLLDPPREIGLGDDGRLRATGQRHRAPRRLYRRD